MNVREPLPTGDEKVAPLSDERPPSRRLYFLVAVAVLGALAWGAYGRWQQRRGGNRDAAVDGQFRSRGAGCGGKGTGRPGRSDTAGYRASVRPGEDLRACHRIRRRAARGYRQPGRTKAICCCASRHPISTINFQRPRPGWCRWRARWNRRVPRPNSRARMRRSPTSRIPRTLRLATQGWESKQNADNTRLGLASKLAAVNNAEAGVKVAEASIRAQEATVQRLRQMTQFERVEAPFEG